MVFFLVFGVQKRDICLFAYQWRRPAQEDQEKCARRGGRHHAQQKQRQGHRRLPALGAESARVPRRHGQEVQGADPKPAPIMLSGKDVVAMTRTGSGKTAAFIKPMLEKLKEHSKKIGVRALILSPTRELVVQTMRFTKMLTKSMDLKITLIVSGECMEQQFESIAFNPDIIAATPVRLMHHLLRLSKQYTWYHRIEQSLQADWTGIPSTASSIASSLLSCADSDVSMPSAASCTATDVNAPAVASHSRSPFETIAAATDTMASSASTASSWRLTLVLHAVGAKEVDVMNEPSAAKQQQQAESAGHDAVEGYDNYEVERDEDVTAHDGKKSFIDRENYIEYIKEGEHAIEAFLTSKAEGGKVNSFQEAWHEEAILDVNPGEAIELTKKRRILN